jgi:hypothetical protein
VSLFRSQLVLEEQRRLYDVWLDAAGRDPMPSRQAFQPRAFAALLPWISLIECQSEDHLRVRVAGSQLRDVLQGDDPVKALVCPEADGGAVAVHATLRARSPVNGTAVSHCERQGDVMRFWMRLPLGRDGQIDSLIGLDIALTRQRAPQWALARIAV